MLIPDQSRKVLGQGQRLDLMAEAVVLWVQDSGQREVSGGGIAPTSDLRDLTPMLLA